MTPFRLSGGTFRTLFCLAITVPLAAFFSPYLLDCSAFIASRDLGGLDDCSYQFHRNFFGNELADKIGERRRQI